MRKLIVRARAQGEIESAFEWYRARSANAAIEYLDAVDQSLGRIVESPEQFPVVRGQLRRALLSGFPYAVYFKVYDSVVSVVGVIHGHRHPDTWRGLDET